MVILGERDELGEYKKAVVKFEERLDAKVRKYYISRIIGSLK